MDAGWSDARQGRAGPGRSTAISRPVVVINAAAPASHSLLSYICIADAATVGVVGVRTPQKFKLGVSDTPKKLKGNVKPI